MNDNNQTIEVQEVNEEIAEKELIKDRYLTFFIAEEGYGMPIAKVIEIVSIQQIAPVPNTAPYVKGVINLRGNVIPIIDIRLRFLMKEKEYNERTCIIVIQHNDALVGLIVDRISDVVDIPGHQLEPSPDLEDFQVNFIKGIGKIRDEIRMLIDIDKLLAQEKENSPIIDS